MKQSDIALIILIVAISLVASYFVGGALINSPDSRSKQVLSVEPVNDTMSNPADSAYSKIFDKNAINPAINIRIGESETDKPFTTE